MNIFGKTLIPLFLATVMLVSCSSFLATPTLSQADRMETAISTASTAFVALTETQRAIPSATVEVYADQDWQDTGVTLRVNDKFEVKYISGTWSICPCWGYVDPAGHSLSPHPPNPIPLARRGELIGKIGQSIFRMGRQELFVARDEGHLYLRINDDIITDNDGVLLVQITGGEAEIRETAISTVSTGLTETQRAIPTVPPQGSGLLGRYYIVRGQIPPANPFRDGNLVLTRVDKTVDFIWPYGGRESPGAAMTNDLFAISWDGQVYAPVTGVYTFGTYHDDGARLYVDNTLLYDDWKEGETRKAQNRISLIAGTWYPIRLEFWENVWTAEVQLFWSFPGQVENIIPSVNLKPDISTALAETQPALPTPSTSSRLICAQCSHTPRPPTPTKTASPVPPSTEEAALSSTPAPETLTPGPLTCQLNINQNIHVLDGTNLWSQPDVVNGSLIGTLPAGTSVYVISAPAWGRTQETGVSGWWWEISNESNGAGTGWIWEGRIAECN